VQAASVMASIAAVRVLGRMSFLPRIRQDRSTEALSVRPGRA
jgi:hypothetical protein